MVAVLIRKRLQSVIIAFAAAKDANARSVRTILQRKILMWKMTVLKVGSVSIARNEPTEHFG